MVFVKPKPLKIPFGIFNGFGFTKTTLISSLNSLKFHPSLLLLLTDVGFCAVSYSQSLQEEYHRQYDGLVEGNPSIVVEYAAKYYFFASETQRDTFMRNPSNYVNLSLPKKLPPSKAQVPVIALPLPGYLEQTAASILVDGLHQLITFKPKFPHISGKESVLKFLALYIKGKDSISMLGFIESKRCFD